MKKVSINEFKKMVMKKAWNIFKCTYDVKFAECLRRAWKFIKAIAEVEKKKSGKKEVEEVKVEEVEKKVVSAVTELLVSIPEWFLRKNFAIYQNGRKYKVYKETEKAYLVEGHFCSEFWCPKSICTIIK